MYFFQRTLKKTVRCYGIGLHSGKIVNLSIRPAPVNTGIIFIRVDLPGMPKIKAHFSNVVDNSLATVIGNKECVISTVEHLMASFYGMSIDNAIVEIDNYEIPILDGSSKPFIDLIYKSGIKKQNKPRIYLLIKKSIKLLKKGKYIAIYPNSKYRITSSINYLNFVIGEQRVSFEINNFIFEKQIAPCRTFGFFNKINFLKEKKLTIGGSFENAVVLSSNEIMNKKRLRFRDEFIRHKILDCIGDFSLIGMPILAHIITNKAGHEFNRFFLKNLFDNKFLWETSILN